MFAGNKRALFCAQGDDGIEPRRLSRGIVPKEHANRPPVSFLLTKSHSNLIPVVERARADRLLHTYGQKTVAGAARMDAAQPELLRPQS